MPRKATRQYRDYSIRPMGSMEVSFDPIILEKIIGSGGAEPTEDADDSRRRAHNVAKFIIRMAMQYLPPKQRKVFFSVWCRSGGRLNKGIMDFSRKTGQSHFTNYNNYRKAMNSLKMILEKTGYGEYLVMYMRGELNG